MSNIRDTDLVLVSRSGTSYDCPASELSNRLRDGDYLLVSRSGTPYKVSGSNIDNIRDNDTLLISRGSTPYKVTGADFKQLLGRRWGFDFNITSFINAGVVLPSGSNAPLQVNEIIPNSYGEVYGVGTIHFEPYGANRDLLLFKLNTDGSLAWTRTLHSPTMASTIYDAEYAFTGDVDTSGNLSLLQVHILRTNLHMV